MAVDAARCAQRDIRALQHLSPRLDAPRRDAVLRKIGPPPFLKSGAALSPEEYRRHFAEMDDYTRRFSDEYAAAGEPPALQEKTKPRQ